MARVAALVFRLLIPDHVETREKARFIELELMQDRRQRAVTERMLIPIRRIATRIVWRASPGRMRGDPVGNSLELRLKPDFSITDYMERLTYRESSDLAHHGEGLRKVDLPE